MKTGRYNLRDLLTHNEIEQIIVPEIQRDYVWKEDNVIKLLNSIKNNYEKKGRETIAITLAEKPIAEEGILKYLQEEYEKLKFNLKIGFIYAYHDNEYPGKFFLIDGQQRITTLFLLLFELYKKLDKRDEFNQSYFVGKQLKLDYKVREASHDFLYDFINYEEGEIETSSRFYKSEYEKDVTVKNILTNRKHIANFVTNNDLIKDDFLKYVENFIEFNYFDTNISEQGEQLYIYMNSRGEHLSSQELIRSEIIRKEQNSELKKMAGKKWEEWQNYFWQKRGENENADKGFEEFLKWTTIIDLVKNPNSKFLGLEKKEAVSVHRKSEEIVAQKKLLQLYQAGHLNIEFLSKIFEATKFFFSIKSDFVTIEKIWLSNPTSKGNERGKNLDTIDYILFIPLIYFISESNWSEEAEKLRDIESLAMFLKNISYFETNAKSPDTTVLNSLRLVKVLIEQQKTDILCLLEEDIAAQVSKSILTESEIRKLKEYQKAGLNRVELEHFFWKITNDREFSIFFLGNLNFFFEYLDKQNGEFIIDAPKIQRLARFYTIVKETLFIFNTNKKGKSDLLIRGLLTFGDYCLIYGNSHSAVGYRVKYSFCRFNNRYDNEWRQLMNKGKKEIVFDFFADIEKQYHEGFDFENYLNRRIEDYNDTDWKEPFIKDSAILAYCQKKKFLWSDTHKSKIVLLRLKKAKSWNIVYLPCYLLSKKFNNPLPMGFYENKRCYIDFSFQNQDKTLISIPKEYRLEVRFNSHELHWEMYLFHQCTETQKEKLMIFEGDNWRKENDYLVNKQNGFLYDEGASLLDNIDIMEKEVKIQLEVIRELF